MHCCQSPFPFWQDHGTSALWRPAPVPPVPAELQQPGPAPHGTQFQRPGRPLLQLRPAHQPCGRPLLLPRPAHQPRGRPLLLPRPAHRPRGRPLLLPRTADISRAGGRFCSAGPRISRAGGRFVCRPAHQPRGRHSMAAVAVTPAWARASATCGPASAASARSDAL